MVNCKEKSNWSSINLNWSSKNILLPKIQSMLIFAWLIAFYIPNIGIKSKKIYAYYDPWIYLTAFNLDIAFRVIWNDKHGRTPDVFLNSTFLPKSAFSFSTSDTN